MLVLSYGYMKTKLSKAEQSKGLFLAVVTVDCIIKKGSTVALLPDGSNFFYIYKVNGKHTAPMMLFLQVGEFKRLPVFTDLDRKQIVQKGFNYAGNTTDETAVAEIERDYKAGGYSEIIFKREHDLHCITYWTKHPQINP